MPYHEDVEGPLSHLNLGLPQVKPVKMKLNGENKERIRKEAARLLAGGAVTDLSVNYSPGGQVTAEIKVIANAKDLTRIPNNKFEAKDLEEYIPPAKTLELAILDLFKRKR